MNLTPHQKEELRHAALEFLADRQGAAFASDKITRRLVKDQVVDFAFTDEDVTEALVFLADLDPARVKFINSDMGSSRYAQATSAGVLAVERGRAR